MLRFTAVAAGLFAVISPFVHALAAGPSITVQNAWARATPGAGGTGSVYLTVTDHGAPDSITGVSTPAAGMAMLHETINDNGVMKMRMLDGVKLEPDRPVTLSPGAMHIMLESLSRPLKAGDTFPLTLSFAQSAPVTVTVTVAKAGAMAAPPAAQKVDDGMAGMTMNGASKP